jgi:hypothetical protein
VTPGGRGAADPAPRRRLWGPALLVRLVINLAAPVLAYVLVRPHVHSDVAALVAGAAVPIAYTAGVLVRRRRLDAIGAFAIACFAVGLLLAVATGGNELVFKLREEIWSGPAGLACLISVAVGRPLFLLALQLAARRNAEIAGRISDPPARRIAAVTTAVTGIILVVHAVVIAALALTVSTTVFLAAKAPISLVTVGGGAAALVWWIRRQLTSASTVRERRITMPIVTIPRTDVTSEQVGAALRDGLDDRYDVLPGMRMPRLPVGRPQAAGRDEIVVGKGSSPMVRAQVTVIHRADRTDIRITPGGVAGDLVMNTLGIARRIRHVLLAAPGLGA